MPTILEIPVAADTPGVSKPGATGYSWYCFPAAVVGSSIADGYMSSTRSSIRVADIHLYAVGQTIYLAAGIGDYYWLGVVTAVGADYIEYTKLPPPMPGGPSAPPEIYPPSGGSPPSPSFGVWPVDWELTGGSAGNIYILGNVLAHGVIYQGSRSDLVRTVSGCGTVPEGSVIVVEWNAGLHNSSPYWEPAYNYVLVVQETVEDPGVGPPELVIEDYGGLQYACAIADAWGSPVAVAPGDGLLLTDGSINTAAREYKAREVPTQTGQQRGIYSDPQPEAHIAGWLRYEGWDKIFCSCLGRHDAIAGGHHYEILDRTGPRWMWDVALNNMLLTFAIWNGAQPDILTTAKVASIRISGEVGRPLRIEARLMGAARSHDDGLNDQETIMAASAPASPRVLYAHASVTDNGIARYPQRFALDIDMGLTHRHEVRSNCAGQPRQRSAPRVGLALGFKGSDMSAYQNELGSSMVRDYALVFAAGAYRLTLRVPNASVTAVGESLGWQRSGYDVQLVGSALDNHYSDKKSPVIIETVNSYSYPT